MGFFHHPRISQRQGRGHLSRSVIAMSIVAADKWKLCRLTGRVEKNYRYFNGGILAAISLARRISFGMSWAQPQQPAERQSGA